MVKRQRAMIPIGPAGARRYLRAQSSQAGRAAGTTTAKPELAGIRPAGVGEGWRQPSTKPSHLGYSFLLISSLFELVEMAEVKRKRKRINERAK